MTRQQKSTPDLMPRRDAVALSPIQPQRSLTAEVIGQILEEISTGRLGPGQRLPTEQEMMASMGVSRTVVREAISALKAQGMVTTRQGSGAFVSTEPPTRGFTLDPEMIRSIDSVINILELRLAVEAEAAGLACLRGEGAGYTAIRAAHARFVAAIDGGGTGADEDFAFHVAIATATGNPQFPDFLRFLGTFVIPRQNLRVWGMTFSSQAEYLAHIKKEHGGIVEAITSRDPERARAAMRDHLSLASSRYRSFAAAAQAHTPPQKQERLPS